MLSRLAHHRLAIVSGLIATLIGLIAFLSNWFLWDLWNGPLPGYQIVLFPGNLSLMYVWHPLFTEEIVWYIKLGMILTGQFVVVTIIVGLIKALYDLFRAM